jgi:putative spermidine/putrescine transport system substrate-binding protein
MRKVKLRYVALALVAGRARGPRGRHHEDGANEGKLTMIAWEGYLDAKWVKPFEQQSGCKVQAKYAGSSDEMVTLMRSGGGGQYDLVSASGDASLRLIYGGDVAAVDVGKVPGWKQFFKGFQRPPNNTVEGKHYGISLQWGPNTLIYNTTKVKPAPTSWSGCTARSTRARSPFRTTRSRSRTRRCTCRRRSRRSGSRTRTS